LRHRAVFFDFGGTLFSYAQMRPHFDRMLGELARRHAITAPMEEIHRTYRSTVARKMAEFLPRPFYLHRDLFGEVHVDLLTALGADPDESRGPGLYEGQSQVGLAAVQPREGVGETLAALRQWGLHLGIVSNIDDDQFQPLWERIGLGPCFDAITTSEEAHSCKPHPGIYRHALGKAGNVAPELLVFVGDSLHYDVAGARALGMTTVLITDHGNPVEGGEDPDHVIETMPQLLEILSA
jgi:HAD superfamily hydrolase (TIGR01509 family)